MITSKVSSTSPAEKLSIDEQIVPFKGTSSTKTYNPKKPKKWGYKIFVLSGTNGLVYNFKIYAGNISPVPGQPDLKASGNIVLDLLQPIPKGMWHKVYFDNWFNSPLLQTTLWKQGFGSLGTVRLNRFSGCNMPSDTQMKHLRRGTSVLQVTQMDDVELRVVKWFSRDKTIQKAWVIRCRRRDKINLQNAQICSIHFQQDDFEDEVKSQILGVLPKCLKSTAVPSIHLPESSSSDATVERSARLGKRDHQKFIDAIMDQTEITGELPRPMDDSNIIGQSEITGEEFRRPMNHFQDDSDIEEANHERIDKSNQSEKSDNGGQNAQENLKHKLGILEEENVHLRKELMDKDSKLKELMQENNYLRKQYNFILKKQKNELQAEIKTILSPLFSETQINAIIGKKVGSHSPNSYGKYGDVESRNAFGVKIDAQTGILDRMSEMMKTIKVKSEKTRSLYPFQKG
ncbi:uncharacterized protein [Macrobrachium rosenbergii]|uniref:uncharacterized protein n=1 Tax=Macrobrachium rosenbergii TaxID=79674 RepID=UPI0034D3C597